jgi:hypothetical protein
LSVLLYVGTVGGAISSPRSAAIWSGRKGDVHDGVLPLARCIVTEDGELIRELVLDPSRLYQPMGTAWAWNDVPGHV